MSLQDLLDVWTHAGVPAPVQEAELIIKLIQNEGKNNIFFSIQSP